MFGKEFVATALTVLAVAVGASPLAPAGPKTKIGDVTGYSVLLPTNPDCQEKYAANLLAEGIGKLTGFTPQVIEEDGTLPSGRFFAVGRTALAEKAHVVPLTSEQGYKLSVSGGDVFVTGGTRGPFQAVVALLEEDWGVRWYTRYAKPKYPKTAVDGLTVTPRQYVPPFDVREYLHRTILDSKWALFNRYLNMSYFLHTTREMGGGYVAEKHFCHNYEILVPTEKYFETHPEYFTLVGGKRLKNANGMNDGQVCYTSKGVEEIMSAELDKYLDENPDVRVIGLTANDNLNLKCECPTCLPLYEREGSVGLQMDLANRVARRLKVKHPGVTLYTWAYAATQLPPPTLRPDDNVGIFYAPIRHRAQPLVAWRDQKELMQKEFLPWTKIAKNIFLWDYARVAFAPSPNFLTMQDNLRLWREHKVRGVFVEDCEWEINSLDALKRWVFAKLFWNPDLDVLALVDEFVTGAYGAAAESMRTYVKVQLDAFDRFYRKNRLGTGLELSADDILTMRHSLEQAWRLAEKSQDKEVSEAVAREFVPFLHERLAACRPDAVERYEKDLKLMRRLTDMFDFELVQNIDNAKKFERWEKKLAQAKGGGNMPVYGPSSLLLTEKILWTKVRALSKPETGALAGTPGRHTAGCDWQIQYDFSDLLAAAPGMQVEYVCRARVKPLVNGRHDKNDPACGLHAWMAGREGCPGGKAAFGKLPANGEWGFVYFFRILAYSSSGTGYFYTTSEQLADEDAILFDYLEFIPVKDFKDRKLAESLPQITL